MTHPLITALTHALAAAGELSGVPADEIAVLKLKAVEWPTACLGVPGEGEACPDVVTPGYRIRLAGGFVYHADQHGNGRVARKKDPYPDTEIRLTFSVSGGITGRSTSFTTNSWRLTDTEEQELRRLVDAADFFNVRNVEPTPIIADGIVRRLSISVGRRHHEVVRGDGIVIDDTEAFRALVAWAADRTPPMFPGGTIALD